METLLKRRRRELCLKRYNEAHKRVKTVIDFLRGEGATEVFLFGSITSPERFTEHSDIDIAVRGISEDKRLDVEGCIADLLGEFEYDILFLEEEGEIRKEVLESIREEAILWSH